MIILYNNIKLEKNKNWEADIKEAHYIEASFSDLAKWLTDDELSHIVSFILAKNNDRHHDFYARVKALGLNLFNWQIYYLTVEKMTRQEKIQLVEEILQDDV